MGWSSSDTSTDILESQYLPSWSLSVKIYGVPLLQDDHSHWSLVSPQTTLQSSDLIREGQWPFVWVISKICDGSEVEPNI